MQPSVAVSTVRQCFQYHLCSSNTVSCLQHSHGAVLPGHIIQLLHSPEAAPISSAHSSSASSCTMKWHHTAGNSREFNALHCISTSARACKLYCCVAT
eukprot:12709-Heterococcus_DN1.PRE.9